MKTPNTYFTRTQRTGILVLLFVIIGLQVMIINYDKIFPTKPVTGFNIPEDLQAQYDSLRNQKLNRQKQKIFPFNPNYLTDYKAYYLGIDLQALQRIQAYRQQGKYFNSKQEFKQVSGISDSLFAVLEPYINIPDLAKKYVKNRASANIKKTDINKATANNLMQVNGVGQVLSKRIIKYRDAIGGFTQKKQINKVYGLEPEAIQRIWQHFYLKAKKSDEKLRMIYKKDINKASLSDLQEVPGIGEKLSERIIKYRQKTGGFLVKEQLDEIYGLKPEVVQRLWQYFDIKSKPVIKNKINLNIANIKELAENPYISYSLSKRIISYRTLHGKFHSFDELLKIDGFPKNKLNLITLYLEL